LDDTKYIVDIFVESLVVQFILNPQRDQHAAGHADGQTRNIDKGKTFVLSKISERHFQIIFKHD
jgi:hypothetical protein